MFDESEGATAELPELLAERALRDDVAASTSAAAEALRTAVVRILDEHDADLVHLPTTVARHFSCHSKTAITTLYATQMISDKSNAKQCDDAAAAVCYLLTLLVRCRFGCC